jgi:hypothetical protein
MLPFSIGARSSDYARHSRSLPCSLRLSDLCILAIEQHSHLPQTIATSFRIIEIHSDNHNDQECDENNVVSPPDGLKGDRIDEDVEGDRKLGCCVCYS